jgi:uncharacterized membrane protein
VKRNWSRRGGDAMKLLRFVVPGLCAVGVAACAFATARLLGWVPVGKLAPYPAWTVIHFLSATAFAVLAPLQLWPRLRARRPHLHRAIGRTAVALGAVMALSGIAMAYATPDRPLSERIFMTAFFLAYAAFLGLGLRAALARHVPAHRAWMARMTATALTPVTQRLVFPIFAASLGIDGLDTFWQLFVSSAWIAWALNMSVAEAWLQRASNPAAPPRQAAAAAP